MSTTTKDTGRATTVRTISGHNVTTGTQTSGVAIDPSTSTAVRLAGSQPNTDRRRFLITGGKK